MPPFNAGGTWNVRRSGLSGYGKHPPEADSRSKRYEIGAYKKQVPRTTISLLTGKPIDPVVFGT